MTLRQAAPSMLTLCGLFFSFWAIVAISDGDYEKGAWIIWAAAMVDLFDGGVARALNAISAFGRDLDSLADFVTAGVAPAFLVHQVYFADWEWFGLIPPFVWLCCVAARLARFNTIEPRFAHYFHGVPCPPTSTTLVHYFLFSLATFDNVGNRYVVMGLIVVLGWLMLSNVPYEKARWLAPHRILRNPYGLGTSAMIVMFFFAPRQAIFFWTSVSLVLATGRYFLRGEPEPRLAVAST